MESVNKLVNDNLLLIKYFMNKYPMKDTCICPEDYESELLISLWKSALGYDPSKGFAFSTYAMHGFKFVRSRLWKTVGKTRGHHQLLTTDEYEPSENGRIKVGYKYTDEDVADLKRNVELLPVREKTVVKDFFSGKSLSDIARERKSSRQWISRVYNDAVVKLKRAMA